MKENNPSLRKLISLRIRYALVYAKKTQEDLASYCNVSQVTVSNWILAKSDIKVKDYIKVMAFFTLSFSNSFTEIRYWLKEDDTTVLKDTLFGDMK